MAATPPACRPSLLWNAAFASRTRRYFASPGWATTFPTNTSSVRVAAINSPRDPQDARRVISAATMAACMSSAERERGAGGDAGACLSTSAAMRASSAPVSSATRRMPT